MAAKPEIAPWEIGCGVCLLSFDHSAIGNLPVVYAIGSKKTGKWVYVGKTTNPRKRFDGYRYPTICHNAKLRDWLIENKSDVFVEISHVGRNGLDDAERRAISMVDGLFNIMDGGDQAWRNHVTKPWMAGIGVKCPSSLALEKIEDASERDRASAWREKLNDGDRCRLEVSIAIELLRISPLGVADRVNVWLDRCQTRLLECMEASA